MPSLKIKDFFFEKVTVNVDNFNEVVFAIIFYHLYGFWRSDPIIPMSIFKQQSRKHCWITASHGFIKQCYQRFTAYKCWEASVVSISSKHFYWLLLYFQQFELKNALQQNMSNCERPFILYGNISETKKLETEGETDRKWQRDLHIDGCKMRASVCWMLRLWKKRGLTALNTSEEGERLKLREKKKDRYMEKEREAESLSAYLGLFERESCCRNNVPASPHKKLDIF